MPKKYRYKYIRSPDRIQEHIVIVERALGKKLPIGAIIHHFDENTTNNKNNNLVVCQDKKYHRLLHALQRIVNAGGNPHLDKICSSCHLVKNKEEYYISNSAYDKLTDICKSCSYLRLRAYRDREKFEKQTKANKQKGTP